MKAPVDGGYSEQPLAGGIKKLINSEAEVVKVDELHKLETLTTLGLLNTFSADLNIAAFYGKL